MREKPDSILLNDNQDPDRYGVVDSKIFKTKSFILYVASPFVKPGEWVTDRFLYRNCKLIVGSYRLPYSSEVSNIWEFAKTNNIPFKDYNLSERILENYVFYNGCVFYNVANKGDCARLLLVHIPQSITTINFKDDPCIIGLSTNTVDLSNVIKLSMPGRLYGSFKNNKYFSRVWNRDGRLMYDVDSKTKLVPNRESLALSW